MMRKRVMVHQDRGNPALREAKAHTYAPFSPQARILPGESTRLTRAEAHWLEGRHDAARHEAELADDARDRPGRLVRPPK
jgi:hypothetical protein